MSVKVITFISVFPIIISILNSLPIIYPLLSSIGYLIVVSVIVWEFTNRLIYLINKYGFGKVNPSKKIVLITGCDSGFGYLTAKQVNKYGFTVFATCLQPEGDGVKRLRTEICYPDKLVIVGCDVTKDDQIDNVYLKLNEYISDGYELWGIVNNAGILVMTEAENGTFQNNYGNVFEVNCFGMVKVTRKFLPLIRLCKGRVVIIASILGRITHSFTVSYSMSKHAAISFADGLRLSMIRFGVDVVSIEPFAYKTALFNTANTQITNLWNETNPSVKRDYGEKRLSEGVKIIEETKNKYANKNPEDVSDAVLDALTVPFPNKRQFCTDFWKRVILSLTTIIPTDFMYFLSMIAEKVFRLF